MAIPRTVVAIILNCVLLATTLCSEQKEALQHSKISNASPNTWVVLSEESTGARQWPIVYFDPVLGNFVVCAGSTSKEGHYDTELFDAQTGSWSNAYPKDAPPGPASGPAGLGAVEFRENESPIKMDKNGFQRILRAGNSYTIDPYMYHQYAYHPEEGCLYALFQECMLRFDPKTRTWIDLKIPFEMPKSPPQKLHYGALAYDPISKEIISFGGICPTDGGSPGTWSFSPVTRTWKRLPQGSTELNALNKTAKQLEAKANAFTNACRNRYHLTETEVESRARLGERALELASEIEKFSSQLGAARLSGVEVNAPKMAQAVLEKVAPALKACSEKLNARFSVELLQEIQIQQDALQRAQRCLDAEPCGRGISPMVLCPDSGKIVLFGGCRLDTYLSDTWVFDCKTRTWEQRYPKVVPAPRAGHILAWLPKSKKVVLYGATGFSCMYGVPHGNATPAQELWTYDVISNEWKLLKTAEKNMPSCQGGAVDANDMLLGLSTDPKNKKGRVTFAMIVDPNAPDAGSAAAGVAPASVKLVFDSPLDYDKALKPDTTEATQLIRNTPANIWTQMPTPPKKTNGHEWGTAPYDTRRQQIIAWGGGHSAWHYTDAGHYSMRTGAWSTGYAEEFPYANAAFCAMFTQTFNNRPAVPVHLWNSAAYDSELDKVVFCVHGQTWLYDPISRSWGYPPLSSPGSGTKMCMKSTPKGVLHWDKSGELHLFDRKTSTWKKAPLTGGKLTSAFCDRSGMVYDSKRNTVWFLYDNQPVKAYDLATGELTSHPTPTPENVFMRETVYVPELDMLLNASRVSGLGGEAGNLAYDIENKKWIGIELPCSDGKPHVEHMYSVVSYGINYDPELQRVIWNANTQAVWVARLQKAGLKTFEVKMQQPKEK